MNGTYVHRMGRFSAGPTETLDDALSEALAQLAPFIVGVRRQIAPPVFLGSERLHRMHVLVVNPVNDFRTASPSDELEQVLPRLSCWPMETAARPVLGELLRGERGGWYERIGQRIRPLRQLVAGPAGEILEVPTPVVPAPLARVARQRLAEPLPEDAPEPEDSAGSVPELPSRAQAIAAPPPFRKLLGDPGAWRVVPLGAFKPMLAPQLAHPARLRDLHRLPCHAQVFEATAPQPIETLVHLILGDQAGPLELQPLTPAVAAQIGLAPLLPAPTGVPPFVPEQGAVRPGQQFFRLTVASDPTANPPQAQAAPATAVPPNGQAPAPSAVAPARRTEIPVPLLRPWEFRRTRDEAMAILGRASSWLGWLTRPLRRFGHRAEFRRWQLLLSGRNADEQLWAVPPPRGWLGDPWLREWARSTLELGGYDSNVLLAEWEIFWGRKGT
jgi:hypothetical protein